MMSVEQKSPRDFDLPVYEASEAELRDIQLYKMRSTVVGSINKRLRNTETRTGSRLASSLEQKVLIGHTPEIKHEMDLLVDVVSSIKPMIGFKVALEHKRLPKLLHATTKQGDEYFTYRRWEDGQIQRLACLDSRSASGEPDAIRIMLPKSDVPEDAICLLQTPKIEISNPRLMGVVDAVAGSVDCFRGVEQYGDIDPKELVDGIRTIVKHQRESGFEFVMYEGSKQPTNPDDMPMLIDILLERDALMRMILRQYEGGSQEVDRLIQDDLVWRQGADVLVATKRSGKEIVQAEDSTRIGRGIEGKRQRRNALDLTAVKKDFMALTHETTLNTDFREPINLNCMPIYMMILRNSQLHLLMPGSADSGKIRRRDELSSLRLQRQHSY